MRIAALLLFVSAASAQNDVAFEVASIKPAAPQEMGRMFMGSRGGPGTKDPGRFTCTNCPLTQLVSMAYGLNNYQLTAPAWMNGERFDISAKVPEGATKETFRLMMQNLLAERFKLVIHRETKELPIYELQVGKGGHKLKESVDPAKDLAQSTPPPPGPPKIDKDGYPAVAPGMMAVMNGRARMNVAKQAMSDLAGRLSAQLGKPVIDKTGLTGKYDYVLSWSFDMGMAGRGPNPPLPPPPPGPAPAGGPLAAAPEGESGPTLIGAVQEQLGLKLESKKGPVEMVVVDKCEKTPTEN